MKIQTTAILALFFLTSLISCQNNNKNQAKKEIHIEKMVVNDSIVKATITTSLKQGDKITKEIEVIEGNKEDIDQIISKYSSENSHKNHETDSTDKGHKEMVKKVSFSLNPKSGTSTSGMVTFTESEGKVSLEAHINGLTPGVHAIHIHEKADCSSDDGKSSGGHWNPTFESHGSWGSDFGFHRGDIGNFIADESGHGMVQFSTDLWCIGCEDENKNILGKAIIVHQGEDDLLSQPSGAAGARISCAGLIQ